MNLPRALITRLIQPSLIAGLTLLIQLGAVAENRLPNFITILTDDQGYADLGCFGATDFKTPHLDQMAAEGARLTSFYVPASACSASRASLLTGRYPDRIGISEDFSPTRQTKGQPASPGADGLDPDEVTIAEVLEPKGYATACIGKWHLGDAPEFLPVRQGFDSYFGLPYSNDMGWWQGKPEDFNRDLPPIPLIQNDTVVETNPDQRYLTRRYTEKAVRFIQEHGEQPFFLYLAHSMPHVPLFVSERFSGSAEYGLYGDVVQEIDWSVGEILKTLKEAGLDEDTLVIFTSDNGPDRSRGAHGGKADPLRDGKFTRYEGGHRVPCLVRWPGKIAAGSDLDGMASTIDLLPTLANLAEADLAEDLEIDGLDLWPWLSGANPKSPRNTFFYSPWVVRKGKWKLMMPGRYREVVTDSDRAEDGRVAYSESRLFDLETDISESKSLPNDDAHREVFEELIQLCKDYQEALQPPDLTEEAEEETPDDSEKEE